MNQKNRYREGSAILFYLVCNSLCLNLCSQNTACGATPDFINSYNMDQPVLSTEELFITGLCLYDQATIGKNSKLIRYPTWDDYGHLSSIFRDPDGNAYLFPVPSVNTLYNDPLKQNILLRLDSKTGELSPYFEFPAGPKNEHINPFGILGINYNCYDQLLYVCSVYHSDRKNEKGVIYVFDPKTKKIIDKMENIDGMGLIIQITDGKKNLLIGSARTPDVWQMDLDSKGLFTGALKKVFSLEGLGPRGDDKARRLQVDTNTGDLLVYGTEFYFNLSAPAERQTSIYRYRFDKKAKKWQFIEIMQ